MRVLEPTFRNSPFLTLQMKTFGFWYCNCFGVFRFIWVRSRLDCGLGLWLASPRYLALHWIVRLWRHCKDRWRPPLGNFVNVQCCRRKTKWQRVVMGQIVDKTVGQTLNLQSFVHLCLGLDIVIGINVWGRRLCQSAGSGLRHIWVWGCGIGISHFLLTLCASRSPK